MVAMIRSLCKKADCPRPFEDSALSKMSGEEVVRIISMKTRCQNITLLDGEYRVPTLEALKRFLAIDQTDKRTYRSELFDCDNFAYVLMGRMLSLGLGIPFGVAIVHFETCNEDGECTTMCHALNVVVVKDDGRFVLYAVEPQNDNVFIIPPSWVVTEVTI